MEKLQDIPVDVREGTGSSSKPQVETGRANPEVNPYERHRLIAHLGKTFMRR